MPQTIAERLAALEADNASLRAEVDRLKKTEPSPPPPPPPVSMVFDGMIGRPVENKIAMVQTIPDPLPPAMTSADLLALRRIVTAAHPTIAPPLSGQDERRALGRFANALRAVGKLWGSDVLDTKRDVAWWVHHAQTLVDTEAGQADFNGNDFTAAALASSVFYRAWSVLSPVEFGLTPWQIYGSSALEWPLRDTWRDTLKRGAILPPHQPAHVRDR